MTNRPERVQRIVDAAQDWLGEDIDRFIEVVEEVLEEAHDEGVEEGSDA